MANLAWKWSAFFSYKVLAFLCMQCCAMEGSYVTSFYDFFGYLVDNFRKPESKSLLSTEQPAAKRRLDSTTGKFSVYVDFLQWVQRMALTCWSVLKTLW